MTWTFVRSSSASVSSLRIALQVVGSNGFPSSRAFPEDREDGRFTARSIRRVRIPRVASLNLSTQRSTVLFVPHHLKDTVKERRSAPGPPSPPTVSGPSVTGSVVVKGGERENRSRPLVARCLTSESEVRYLNEK
jgi:hypothetical protein